MKTNHRSCLIDNYRHLIEFISKSADGTLIIITHPCDMLVQTYHDLHCVQSKTLADLSTASLFALKKSKMTITPTVNAGKCLKAMKIRKGNQT